MIATPTNKIVDNYGTPRYERIEVTEEMVERLLNEVSLGVKQKEAEQKRARFSNEDIRKFRVRAKRDLFFLCHSVLGYDRLSPNLHGQLCTVVEQTENRRFREFLLPRGHFKSTILTIGHSIQTVLPIEKEDLEYDGWWLPYNYVQLPIQWPATLGPDCRLLIGHETAEGAARFLYAITRHFTSNPLLMSLFPETTPSNRKQKVTKWELELPRTQSHPDPTIDTMGVGAKSQGRHYNKIKLDDIFGDKARDSEAESETTIQWFDNIQSFFSMFSRDTLDIMGTRYAHDDVYAHAHEVYGVWPAGQLHSYIRKVEELNPETKKIEPIFPEEFTPEVLTIIKKNKKVFSAQYENDPDVAGTGFSAQPKYFHWSGINTITKLTGGGAFKQKVVRIDVRLLDICFLIDPGAGTTGGFVVTGMDHVGCVYVLQAIPLALPPSEFTELTFRMVRKWQPRVVAIESDLFAATYEHWWKSEMLSRKIEFSIEAVYTKKRAKDFRIGGLDHYVKTENLWINETQHDLVREFRQWGKTKDIHLLDAIAYGPEVWRPAVSGTFAAAQASASSQMESGRDIVTGYSEIE